MPEVVWRCKVCKELFDDQVKASNCEVTHTLLTRMSIVDASFSVADLTKKVTFPNQITVKFSDKPEDLARYKIIPHSLKVVT